MDAASIAERLVRAGIHNGLQEARWLRDALAHDPAALAAAVARREGREPLQHILGSTAFRYLELAVEPGVFIPRPETETLVTLALERFTKNATVVEPCTGTGAVACSIASEAAPRTVIATDLNPAAVALARKNATALPAVQILEGDLLDPVPAALRGSVDLLVCNPPYLTADQVADADAEVRLHDPVLGLVGGADGRQVTRRLVTESPGWLRAGGWLLVEDDPARVALTVEDMRGAGYVEAAVHEDLTGRARFAVARLR